MDRQPVFPLTEQASAHLDMVRGLAALAVLGSHWRSLFFLNWPNVSHKNLLLATLYAVAKFGHQAVVVFFVLSGFLIGRTVIKDMVTGKWSIKKYALHRGVRLYLVLIPALLLCWFWDGLGMHLFPRSALYLGTSGVSVLGYRVAEWISPRIFFGNLFFLQLIRVPPFGSDSPLWSLSYEFWYYVLFPCLAILFVKTFSFWRRFTYGICFLVVAYFIGSWMFQGFFIWLLGVSLVFIPKPANRILRHYWMFFGFSLFALLGILLVSILASFPQKYSFFDHILGVFVAFFLYTLLHSPMQIGRAYKSYTKGIAGFSYTLYLAHMPFLLFFAALVNHRSQASVGMFSVSVGILVMTILYSYGLARIFERNTDAVRKMLEAKLCLV